MAGRGKVVLNSSVAPEQKAYLEREALRRDCSVSLVLRDAIELYRAAHPEPQRKSRRRPMTARARGIAREVEAALMIAAAAEAAA